MKTFFHAAGRAAAYTVLLTSLLVLLGAGVERAAAQTCVQSTQSAPLSGDTTKHKKPKRRASTDGATIQSAAPPPGCSSDVTAPTVSVSPGTSSYTTAAVSVSINWRDNVGLDQYSHWVYLNGEDVTSRFSYGGTATSATSAGSLTLRPGANTLLAEIWDQAGNYGSHTVTYTYNAPPPNPPPSPRAPAPEMAANQLPTLRETVRAAFWQILERDPSESDLSQRTQQIEGGGATVATLVRDLIKSGEYESRFVTAPGISAGAAVDGVYRHLWDRPATPGEVAQWSSTVAAPGGYRSLVDHIQNDWYPADHFGRDAVPGRPVTHWDARTPLMVEPGHGTDASRSLCLTAPAGLGAIYECATLRVAHALPAVRALNRTRAPTLLYSSEHAHPAPTFGLWVTPPLGRARLLRVEAVVSAGRGTPDVVERARASWAGEQFTPGQAKHVSLSYLALDQRTGVYDYHVRLTATYEGGGTENWYRRGRFSVVNHKDSPFGAGWWLAGLERLELSPSSNGYREILWVGGDGSTRLYQQGPLPEHAAFWVAKDPTGAADTLWASQHYPSASYVRRLAGGGSVLFDAGGRHIATEDRLGRHTWFWYEGTRLHSARVPTTTGFDAPKVPYLFGYNGAGRLSRVSAPDLAGNEARVVYLGPDPSGLVRWIRDPGTPRATDFEYGQYTEWERMTRRVDMRGTVTAFFYDWGAKLARSEVWMGDPAKDIVMQFRNRETRGNPNMESAVAAEHVTTTIDGPRVDVDDRTHFWLDRFGAPRRIVDAAGRETVLTRSDPRFPALVTRTDGPKRGNGERQTQSATYDARGSITSSTDWSSPQVRNGQALYPTTLYEYADTRWPNREQPTRITLPEGEVTRFGYLDNGNREWQQPGDDFTRQVTFQYYTDPNEYGASVGQVRSVTLPAIAGGQSAVELMQYDARGNLSASRTPNGYWSRYHNDHLGRTWRTETPIDAGRVQMTEVTSFDDADRVRESRTVGPQMNDAPEQTLWVKNEYDPEGSLRSVERWSHPDPADIRRIRTEFHYDLAGRKVAEIAPDGQRDSTYYDRAGNAVRVKTRRHAEIAAAPGGTPESAYVTMEYDVLNRLTARSVPSVYYASENVGTAYYRHANTPEDGPFPLHPNEGSGYRVHGDVARFYYDDPNGTVRATNRDAEVTRTYAVNGALKSEVQRIATLVGQDFSRHEYRVEYAYDLNGRRTGVKHPYQLGPGGVGNDWTRYRFDGLGQLDQVTDALGNPITFAYDERGALRELRRPGGITERFQYDRDGQLTANTITNGSTSSYRYGGDLLRSSAFGYDWRGKLTSTANHVGAKDTLTAAYSGLGHVVNGSSVSRGVNAALQSVRYRSVESFTLDALGNQMHVATRDTTYNVTNPAERSRDDDYRYQMATGRLRVSVRSGARDTLHYDAEGNTRFTSTLSQTDFGEDRYSYYGADGKVRAVDQRSSAGSGGRYQTTFEEYRYDAFGRRVLVYARRYCTMDTWTPECNLDKVRRTVWDGDQELYEIQVPESQAENDGPFPELPMDQTGSSTAIDPNPFFGRVGYTHGPLLDQPLGLLRMGYVDRTNNNGVEAGPRRLAPFALFPLWTTRGQPEAGVYSDGGGMLCESDTRCVKATWPQTFFVLQRPSVRRSAWHGTLLEDKRDEAGTYYRRNRYYDPVTNRFTQEDPIGLAGGLNLYGFANGDPVSYSDPYGLCAKDKDGREDPECRQVINLLRMTAVVGELSQGARDELLYAANVYERFQGDVVFHNAPENRSDGSRPYFAGLVSRDKVSKVELNSGFNAIDLTLTAYHEAQHLAVGRGLVHDSNDRRPGTRDQTDVLQARVYNGLPGWLRDQAKETRYYLQKRGTIR